MVRSAYPEFDATPRLFYIEALRLHEAELPSNPIEFLRYLEGKLALLPEDVISQCELELSSEHDDGPSMIVVHYSQHETKDEIEYRREEYKKNKMLHSRRTRALNRRLKREMRKLSMVDGIGMTIEATPMAVAEEFR